MAYRLEYSQRYNGKHRAWIEVDTFPTFAQALKASGFDLKEDDDTETVTMLSERDRIVLVED